MGFLFHKVVVMSCICCFVSTSSEQTTFDLTTAVLQYLDPKCHMIIVHHNHYSMSDKISPPIPSKKGVYIFHIPKLRVDTSSRYPFVYPLFNKTQYPRAIFATLSKAQFPCFIGVQITQPSDFEQKLDDLSIQKVHALTNRQIDFMYKILYLNSPIIEDGANFRTFLLVRVQIGISRVVLDTAALVMYKSCLHLILEGNQARWYVSGMSRFPMLILQSQATAITSNYSKFYDFVQPPSDVYISVKRKSLLTLSCFYSRSESCEACQKGPYRLVREHRYRPRDTLFFCLGNFSFGMTDHEDFNNRAEKHTRVRGNMTRKTYIEYISADEYRDPLSDLGQRQLEHYYTTIDQGFSFMTCYSREELSFKVLLKPFDVEIWTILVVTLTTIVVFVFILILAQT
ncbi:hypothetical protein Fcan01_19115 [Folsomia candida]|uniref:Uncharacterized protein n=1 Tax=Folsomia candida TaxID=158441 RepID=A0A226DNU7_FOLCA|nr:hypothetical protein Fcan01_19115 [Folsomia candida]